MGDEMWYCHRDQRQSRIQCGVSTIHQQVPARHVVCLHAALQVHLFVNMDNRWSHNVLLSIFCHLRDSKAVLVRMKHHVGSAITTVLFSLPVVLAVLFLFRKFMA